jgi:predicted transcriptional regulator YheO
MEERKRIIEELIPVTRAIVDIFGPNCEALIHDLSDLEHSIVWIEGNLTNRKIGGPMTDLGLIQLKESQGKESYNYTSTTEDGKIIKSTSVIFRNKKGEYLVSLSINLDITAFRTIEHILHGITRSNTDEQYIEHFSDDVNEILDTIIYESEQEIGKSIITMTREEKIALVQKIDERGAFQIKKAAPYIAKRLGVTRYTVYNYLNEAHGITHADQEQSKAETHITNEENT